MANSRFYGAIGCTNNAWGKRAINAIDSVLDDVIADPEYRGKPDILVKHLAREPLNRHDLFN